MHENALVHVRAEGLKRFTQANCYQAQAEWLVLQNEDCPFSIRYRMYRVKGIWFAAQRKFDEARRCFADDVSSHCRFFYRCRPYDVAIITPIPGQ